MKKKNPLFSIVTATHNRYFYLKDLYKSLTLQSFKDIEWVIGDDGSTDKTDMLIKKFIKEKKIRIKYFKSNIRIGKSKIDNIIFPYVSGKYQCYCGSDDYFTKDAFKKMSELLKLIPPDIEKKFNGIATQSVDTKGVSQSFFSNKMPKNNIFMRWDEYSNFVKGDCTLLEKTKAYKNKKFKEVDFLISESTLMNKIHKDKIFLISPIITKIMRRAKNSISFGAVMRYNRGYAHSISINLNKNEFNKLKLSKKVWFVINYWRYLYHGDINLITGKRMWIITQKNILYCLLIPLSIIICIRDILWKDVEKTHLKFEKNKNKAIIEYVKL